MKTTTEIKASSKVTVGGRFFATVLWVRGDEAGVQEYGTKRCDIYQVSRLTAR